MTHDLPEAVIAWLMRIGGGRITLLERAVARREAWIVDVEQPDGSTLKGFLRIDRMPRADDPWSLAKEAGIVEALADTDVPVAGVLGRDNDLACVLFERLEGRADLHNADAPQQRAVMRHFMEVIARLHRLDPETLALPDMPYPTTPYECALGEMDLVLAHHADFLASYRDPLLSYGVDWLRRHAPTSVDRIALVQGDTGPVNFMFSGDRVTAIFDWEWGHLGDPMEDLGNICVREFWNPSGGMTGLLAHYEHSSGIPVDLASVRYYRVQQQMRGMVAIHRATIEAKPHEPITWYLAYRYVGDRATCEAIADAMGIILVAPEYPTEQDVSDPLADAAIWALHHDIAPAVGTPLAEARVKDVDILVRCVARVAAHGAEIQRADGEELRTLLGSRWTGAEKASDVLEEAIAARELSNERLLSYLYNRACRLEWLYRPCVELYPRRNWSQL